MFNRIRRAYRAFKVTEEVNNEELKRVLSGDMSATELFERHGVVFGPAEPIGDGKAEFLGEGTAQEFVEQQRADKGMDKWYKRILNPKGL